MIRRILHALAFLDSSQKPLPQVHMIGGLEVEVWRKAVRGYRISLLPPDGRVRISVPLHMSGHQLEEVISLRMAWIRKHQGAMRMRAERECEDLRPGGWVLVSGRRCRLSLEEAPSGARVLGVDEGVVHLRLPGNFDPAQCRAVMDAWHRGELKRRIPALLEKWQGLIGVHADDWGVKRMKTRWGSCSIRARRIWINLELGKKHPDCLEYVVVHELVHLLEPSHNARFKALMTRFLPDWQARRLLLLEGGLVQSPRDV